MDKINEKIKNLENQIKRLKEKRSKKIYSKKEHYKKKIIKLITKKVYVMKENNTYNYFNRNKEFLFSLTYGSVLLSNTFSTPLYVLMGGEFKFMKETVKECLEEILHTKIYTVDIFTKTNVPLYEYPEENIVINIGLPNKNKN